MKGEKKEDDSVIVDLNEEKVLFEWESSERPFKRRNKEFWITAIIILTLVSIIFLFIKEFFLVIALFSVLFLYYVLATIPPRTILNKITNRGVYYGDLRYEWTLLRRFWFGKSLDSKMIYFETHLRFPRQLAMVIADKDFDKIKEVTVRRIPLLEESPNMLDKANIWFTKKFPLDGKK